ncbi:cytochrome c oxidase assembly protein COX19-like, partial [Trifolium medium]|nr:cytochrome c oxidase assembly protein COX19-like [Trifolium medium]
GWLKCNVDAGFYQNKNITTATRCFRDNEGHFILAQTSWQRSTLSVIEGEGLALLEAIKLAVQRGYVRVIFESGSQILVGDGGPTRFPRLFAISNRKEGSVSEMRQGTDGVVGWDFSWRRSLFVWEITLQNELLELLNPISLSGESDAWGTGTEFFTLFGRVTFRRRSGLGVYSVVVWQKIQYIYFLTVLLQRMFDGECSSFGTQFCSLCGEGDRSSYYNELVEEIKVMSWQWILINKKAHQCCGAFGGNRGLRPVPPEKGIFPLDHMHLCDLVWFFFSQLSINN